MNEASPQILNGLKNLIAPDLDQVATGLRTFCAHQGDRLRAEAPSVVSRAAEWLLSHSEEIWEIVHKGVATPPMSRAMMMEAFRNCVTRWTDQDRLRSLVKDELGSWIAGRPILPEIIFHNLAGNLFISGWESITQAVLMGAGSIVRCSETDRVFPGIWAAALTAVQPEYQSLVAICQWDSGDFRKFRDAVKVSDAIVCYGSDESVQALSQIMPWNKPFAGHGATVSFSLLSADDLRQGSISTLTRASAYDFSAYDQQGCLSPRALFIEDRFPKDVDRFVDGLYDEMKKVEEALPRGVLTLEDKSSLARIRDQVLLDAACGGASRRVSHNHDPFLITVKSIEGFNLGPVNRYVDVYLYKDLDQVHSVLEFLTGRISTMGIPEPKRQPVSLFNQLEVKRVCEFGKMQIPPLAWCLDGLRPLQKYVRYQTIQS